VINSILVTSAIMNVKSMTLKDGINLNLMNMRYFVGFVKKQFLSMIIC